MGTILTATEHQLTMATEWHGGQASTLYAIASTGALSTGTRRPRWSDGEPFTDGEWERYLAGRLADELREVVNGCDRLAAEAERSGRSEEAAVYRADHDRAMAWRTDALAIANADMAELEQ